MVRLSAFWDASTFIMYLIFTVRDPFDPSTHLPVAAEGLQQGDVLPEQGWVQGGQLVQVQQGLHVAGLGVGEEPQSPELQTHSLALWQGLEAHLERDRGWGDEGFTHKLRCRFPPHTHTHTRQN